MSVYHLVSWENPRMDNPLEYLGSLRSVGFSNRHLALACIKSCHTLKTEATEIGEFNGATKIYDRFLATVCS